MKGLFSSLFFLGAILFMPMTSLAWECNVTLDAPKTIKLDQTITLTANGTPTGGSYSWSRTPQLTPAGNTATLIGHKPSYSEYIQVIAYYKTPKGKTCKDVQWIWACVCNVTTLNGPAMAKVGQPVPLTAEAEPTGGSYTWTIESGTGTLTPADSSAEFIGDQAGPVEIKVSYVPPDGGKPCVKYHTIEVMGECEVTLTGELYQRPICKDVNFSAAVQPTGGSCSWAARNGISGSNCNAVYTGIMAINDTVTVTYTSPDGTTCEDSKTILSYSLDMMVADKKCFDSGTSVQHADFTINTTPAGFQQNSVLSPDTLSTIFQHEGKRVTASLVCNNGTSDTSTIVDVVNENVKISSGIEIEIPNLLTEPLEILGLADKLEFSLVNSYEKSKECRTEGPGDSTSGETAIKAEIALKDFTIYGVPLPKVVKKYFSFNALQADVTGKGSVLIKGESEICNKPEKWSGGGNISVSLGVGSKAKVKARYVLIQGEVKGETDIKQTLTVGSSQATVDGQWGGVVLKGLVKIQLKSKILKPIEVSHQVIESGTTPTMTIDLPALQ